MPRVVRDGPSLGRVAREPGKALLLYFGVVKFADWT